ncbi:uncharacterized protein PgNI_05098 [Pyricularia grisea]|uniref:Uncharacterized protein n=1 Tax=Pyricularia grisea TaxID=148305 RepID=A0A6P8BC91_PYRGI|nr:uncharacterized protein PgNI_05098 [Pyricularia grisea]TLD13418.1 hypothetical protein PgNI_05098 [Pyricularia grisea]
MLPRYGSLIRPSNHGIPHHLATGAYASAYSPLLNLGSSAPAVATPVLAKKYDIMGMPLLLAGSMNVAANPTVMPAVQVLSAVIVDACAVVEEPNKSLGLLTTQRAKLLGIPFFPATACSLISLSCLSSLRAILLLQPLDQAHRGVGPVDQVGVERNSGVACRCLSPTYSMTPTPPGTGTRGAYSLTTSFARLIRPKQFQIGLDVSDGVVDAAERVGQALGDVRMVDAGRVEFESSFITCPGYRVSQD